LSFGVLDGTIFYMTLPARIGQDLRRYWLTYLIAFLGSLGMGLGATRIEDQPWALAWIGGVAVAWAVVGTYVKRRTDRRLESSEGRSPS
jgi:1,4-dihydroxy-2-naphthoate octaprenyltransferase